MITTFAEVIAIEQEYVVARCQQKSSCSSCAAKANCGMGLASSAMPSKALTIKLPTEKPITVGSIIEIGIKEEILLKSAVLVYFFPLVFIIFVALIVHLLTNNEMMVIFSSFIVGILSFWLAKVKTAKLEAQLDSKPCLLRVVSYGKN